MNGLTDGADDQLDGLGGVVVSGDDEVDIARIGVGVDDGEDGNAEALCFAYGDVLLEYVYDEECRWQAVEVSDRAEHLLELGALAGDLEFFALGEVIKRAVLTHLVDGGHFLDGLADGGEVGKHASGPALDDVGHAYGGGLFGYDLLSLLLGGHEKDASLTGGDVLEGIGGLVHLGGCFIQIDDVNTVALHEDVWSHGRVPLPF